MTVDKKYKEAIEYLYRQLPMFSRVGAAAYKPGLDTSMALDEYFGHPHQKFMSIHIGGTNGKGSTSHMIASVLQEAGFKTGLYTSPHLVDFRERMRVNGEMIPKEKVVEFVDTWKQSSFAGHPSFFELTMMMAFDWFAEEKVDYAVIEVGMGGRLDSTNIITPILSIITNISHDHNQFLGNTLTEIATEKAGIIKPGIPVVIGEKHEETDMVFEEKSHSVDAPLKFAENEELISAIKGENGGWKCKTNFGEIFLPLGGDYQKKNIATVLSAISSLREKKIPISDQSIRNGIGRVAENTGLKGRWTILNREPLTIADTGHNLAGLEYNIAQLKALINDRPGSTLRIVIGFVADKAIDKILKILPQNAVYYITNAQIPRALQADKLYQLMNSEGLTGTVYENVVSAHKKAQEDAAQNDIIYIGGSTFIVADLFAE